MRKLSLLLIHFFLIIGHKAFALVPLDNLLLGDMSQYVLDRESDPLEYVFASPLDTKESLPFKEFLRIYFSFYKEGENLDDSCRFSVKPKYPSIWDEEQAMRAFVAGVQYTGLELTSRALASYASYFEFSQGEWDNLTGRLIGNYCSQNISVISLKELKNNLNLLFKQEKKNPLPSVQGNPLFPGLLMTLNTEENMKENEFLATVRLFRRFCSWGGENDDVRMLTPILKDPYLMSFFIRRMSGKKIAFEPENESTFIEKVEPLRILCTNLICRRKKEEDFNNRYQYAIGSSGIEQDLRRMYCHQLKGLSDFQHSSSNVIKKWQDIESLDSRVFELGQLTALITGVPDFYMRAERFEQGKELFRFSLDQNWNDWANNQISQHDKSLYYEESLAIELVDRKLYYDSKIPKFSLYFDVNLGEFDRSHQMMGKVKGSFSLKFSKNFLRWIRNEWQRNDPRKPQKKKIILGIMRKHVEDSITDVKNAFKIQPWKGDLATLVAEEILEQVSLYQGSFFRNRSKDKVEIPITISYGVFALRYLSFENKIQKGKQSIDYSDYEYND